jgi:aryl-alcohol dehydrogenase-like predicted oxidoreductase
LTSIREECEASLRRLNVDTIDLYQIHWPKPDEEVEAAWSTMADLQREGKVRWIGVSNFSVEQMKRALKIAPITSLQPPYSMINRAVEPEILPFCAKNNIGVINYSPMHSGLLTGAMTKERVAAFPANDFRRNAKNYQEPHLTRNLTIADLLKKIAARHNVAAGVIAIAWTLHNPAVTAAIVGGGAPSKSKEPFLRQAFGCLRPNTPRLGCFSRRTRRSEPLEGCRVHWHHAATLQERLQPPVFRREV